MSLNVTIFVCLLANLLFSYHVYEAKPTTVKSQSIADVIMNDTLIPSSTRKIVERSKYLEECRKIDFPDKLVNLTDANLNQSLCLAIYDSYVRIGYHNNGADEEKTENISLLNNETQFDEAIKVALKDTKTDPWSLCANLANISSPVLNTTNQFVVQLKSKFAKHKSCTDMCVSESDEINPLCIVLNIIDQQLHAKVGDGSSKKKDVDKTGKYDSKNDSKNNAVLGAGVRHTTTNTTTSTIKDGVNVRKSSVLETKATNGRTKILSGISESNVDFEITDTHKDGAAKPNAKLDRPPMKNPVAETEENPLDNLDHIKQNEESTNIGKSTTISEKTHEDQADQSPEYNDGMTDNAQMGDLDNGDSMDDIPSPITKQTQQLDMDPIDQKEKIPRLPSMRKEDDSHFFGYFTIIGLVGIGGCLIYHHKQKILAMIVEGRRSRGGRGRKRPSTANYRKLDCNLEEAVTSQCNSNVTHVIY